MKNQIKEKASRENQFYVYNVCIYESTGRTQSQNILTDAAEVGDLSGTLIFTVNPVDGAVTMLPGPNSFEDTTGSALSSFQAYV